MAENTEKRGIGYNKNDLNICSTSFLIVLGSGNPNFGARILSVQNLMSIILFILQILRTFVQFRTDADLFN